MNLLLKIEKINGRNQIKDIISKKSAKLKKYLSDNSKLTWNYFLENGRYVSEVKVSGFHGPEIKARASSMSQYKVIDEVVNKINKQLNRKFGQRKPMQKRFGHLSFADI